MAKLKTNSGAKKRFTLTGSGKIKRKHAYHSHILTKKTKKRIKRKHAYHSHILTKKTKKRKRNLDHFALIHDVDVKRVKEMLVL